MRNRTVASWSSGLWLSAVCLSVQAPAQETEPALGEVVVTGQKQAERLIDVPVSATVLDAQAILDARISSLRDIDDYAPNVSFNQTGQVGGTYLTIRGVESNPFIVNRAAVYIDGLPFRELDDQSIAFAESVEILRGPQSTLYGANSESGVALVRTRGPTDRFTAEVQAGASLFRNGSSADVAIYAGGPLVDDRLAGSLIVSGSRADSYLRNIASSINEPGRFSTWNLSGRLRWSPSADWTLNFLALVNRIDAPGLFEQEFAPRDVAVYNANYSNPAFNGARRAAAFDLVNDAPKATLEDEAALGVEAVRELGWGSLTLLASYRREDEDSRGTDLDLTAAPFVAGGNTDAERFLNLEARLASNGPATERRWVLGVNYYADSRDQVLATLAGPGGLQDYRPAPKQRREGRDLAAFGQVSQPLTATTRLTLGLRSERAERRRSQQAGVLDLGFAGQFSFVASDLKATYSDLLPRIALDWKPRQDLTVYGSVSKGWIPGGFNLEAVRGTPSEDFSAYSPERLWSTELGAKWVSADGRTFLSAALFAMRADNWQEYNVLVDAQGRAISTNLIASTARVRILGGEAEIVAQVMDALELRVGLGILDATYRDYRFSSLADFSGNDLRLVPAYDVNASATWRPAGGWFLRGELSGQGRTALNPENTAQQGAFVLAGAQLGYEWSAGSLRLFAENLANQRYVTGAAYTNFLFGNDGTVYVPLGSPQVVGLQGTYRW